MIFVNKKMLLKFYLLKSISSLFLHQKRVKYKLFESFFWGGG